MWINLRNFQEFWVSPQILRVFRYCYDGICKSRLPGVAARLPRQDSARPPLRASIRSYDAPGRVRELYGIGNNVVSERARWPSRPAQAARLGLGAPPDSSARLCSRKHGSVRARLGDFSYGLARLELGSRRLCSARAAWSRLGLEPSSEPARQTRSRITFIRTVRLNVE